MCWVCFSRTEMIGGKKDGGKVGGTAVAGDFKSVVFGCGEGKWGGLGGMGWDGVGWGGVGGGLSYARAEVRMGWDEMGI